MEKRASGRRRYFASHRRPHSADLHDVIDLISRHPDLLPLVREAIEIRRELRAERLTRTKRSRRLAAELRGLRRGVEQIIKLRPQRLGKLMTWFAPDRQAAYRLVEAALRQRGYLFATRRQRVRDNELAQRRAVRRQRQVKAKQQYAEKGTTLT